MAQTIMPKIDFDAYERNLRKKSESYWQSKGRQRAFSLFKKAAELVPAYRDFLKKHRVQPHHIKTADDFSRIPQTNKENYIQAYPLQKRCWNGALPPHGIIAASSGTSGNPNFWIRGSGQEEEAAFLHRFIYRYLCGAEESTLVIIAFPLGVYVSGVATLLPTWTIAEQSRITIVSTGTNKADILLALRTYASSYKTIIMAGHPYFIKDVLETSVVEGNIPPLRRVALVLASEGFSEKWRSYVKKLLAPHADDIRIISMYGSCEFLIMAHETEDSIRVKQKLEEETHEYSVFQYHPVLRYFEAADGELLCTANGAAPLVHHAIHDAGNILPLMEAIAILDGAVPRWKLPFLLLKGRSDQTLVFYAANIYPEHVRQALDHPPFHAKITGKFTLQKWQLLSLNQRFEVVVECRPRVAPSLALKNTIAKHIFSYLLQANKEYLYISQHLTTDVRPHVLLKAYQDPEYFKPGIKPRYIRHS